MVPWSLGHTKQREKHEEEGGRAKKGSRGYTYMVTSGRPRHGREGEGGIDEEKMNKEEGRRKGERRGIGDKRGMTQAIHDDAERTTQHREGPHRSNSSRNDPLSDLYHTTLTSSTAQPASSSWIPLLVSLHLPPVIEL